VGESDKDFMPTLLSNDDAPAVEIVAPEATHRLLITGDHAGNAVPKALGCLGLPPGELDRHIGWDIGVAEVSRRLAARLGATAVLARYTRLLIDPNRPLGEHDLIPLKSDGTLIPANQNVGDDARRARAEAFYWPYHRTVDEQIARLQRMGQVPVLLAMHSFTPALSSTATPRPWHVGVLYGSDARLPRLLMEALRGRGDLVVGDNEPYSGITHGYALKVHGIAHGIPHAELEIRQDLINTPEGAQRWADLLAEILPPILEHPDLKKIEHH